MAAAAGQEQVVSAVEKVVYKGYTIRVGDWVHLANADDAGRPIVAKVLGFQNGNGDTINVRWYYHAEEVGLSLSLSCSCSFQVALTLITLLFYS